jgi:hypothetical protein
MNLQAHNAQLPTPARLNAIAAEFLRLPQAECPVEHRFGPGMYIRQLTIPVPPQADAVFSIGMNHRFPHLSVMLKGRVSMLRPDGEVVELKAPQVFISPPGQKVGIIHEEMVWLNVHATDETDVQKLEAMLYSPSEALDAAREQRLIEGISRHRDDIEDFAAAIAELGFTAAQVRSMSENESDRCDFLMGFEQRFTIAKSPIEGMGVFATAAFEPGETIGPARLCRDGLKRTPLGRYLNHAKEPNAFVAPLVGGQLDVIATKPIRGSTGGLAGDEITLDYRQAYSVSTAELKGIL